MGAGSGLTLCLRGAFRLDAADGRRIEISSKKGMALIGMLATAPSGERTRVWLQDRLWGSRQRLQAQSSLRRELSLLRRALNTGTDTVLLCEQHRVRLDLARFSIDIRAPLVAGAGGEFLEGLDVAGEEGFEDWLREERARHQPPVGRAAHAPAAPIIEAVDSGDAGDAVGTGYRLVSPAEFSARPALAVLAFVNSTGDPGNSYLCEGLSEDLIDRLSRLRWLPVIARNSSFIFESDKTDLRTIGQELGAKYVLQGRLRAAVDGFALTASLSDAVSGYVIWSHRHGLPPRQSQDALDVLVADLVGVLDARIDYAEQARARGQRQNWLEFNNLIWRGRWHLNRLSREDSDLARALFDRALELEPNSPEALIQATFGLGWTLWARRAGREDTMRMRALAQRAIEADPNDGRGYLLAGVAEVWLRQPQRAHTLLERAIALNPSLAWAHAQHGCHYNLVGQPEMATASIKRAIRLSPNDPHVFFMAGELAMACGMLGQFGEAIDWADQSIVLRPGYWYAHMVKINALARRGEPAAGRRALDELRLAVPGFEPKYIDWIPFIDRTWNKWLHEGLEMAFGVEFST